MRVAQAVRPDLFSRALLRHEWIVVWNPVSAIFAHRARRDVFGRVWNDAQNFSDQRIEPLRIWPCDGPQFARTAVAEPDVHDAPFRVAAASRRMEHDLAHRVNAMVELHAQHFAGGTLECEVPHIGVGPLDQDRFVAYRSRRRDSRSGLVSEWSEAETGNFASVRPLRSRRRDPLHVHRVELAITTVIRIELELADAAAVARIEIQTVEYAIAIAAAVEVQVR